MGNATKIFYVAWVLALTLLQNHGPSTPLTTAELQTQQQGSMSWWSYAVSMASDLVYHCTDEPALAMLFIGDAYPKQILFQYKDRWSLRQWSALLLCKMAHKWFLCKTLPYLLTRNLSKTGKGVCTLWPTIAVRFLLGVLISFGCKN